MQPLRLTRRLNRSRSLACSLAGPHILFDDATGTRPVVLYTTLTNWSSSGANNGKDKAFTFAQRIGSAQS